MTARDVVVIGAGGFGREVAQLLRDLEGAGGPYRFAGYLDRDSHPAHQSSTEPLLGTVEDFKGWAHVDVVCAIGDPTVRRRVVTGLDGSDVTWATLRHPTAIIGARTRIGAGSIICAGCVLTVDIEIAEHVHVNLACTVGHDVRIGAYATLSPGCGVSGAALIEPGARLGTQAILLPGVRVGTGSVVGAGSVVLRDVPAQTTVVGIPAKRLAVSG
jgi:sugar O-acyltransferase (sialic acid O-acetyltransferase NeuD family)